jgi:hypothetical protein
VDSIDSKRIGIHEDQTQIGFVATDDKRLHSLWAIIQVIKTFAELLPCVDEVGWRQNGKFFPIPPVEEVASVPPLNGNDRGLGKIGCWLRMGHVVVLVRYLK